MSAATRDYQREIYHPHFNLETISEISEPTDDVNVNDDQTHLSTLDNERISRSSTNSIETFSTIGEVERGEHLRNSTIPKKSCCQRYHWRMTHYFYIHLMVFIFNGLFGGLIVWLIENHSSSRNIHIEVSYLDAWFTTVSCICSCGLTTIDFAKLSYGSHILMMFLAFLSGFAISTLPALIIRTCKNTDDTNENENENENNDEHGLQKRHLRQIENLSSNLRNQLKLLPTATQLRYRAYVTCLLLILGMYLLIYLTGFIALVTWLEIHDTPEYLSQNNITLNPWYVSCMLTLFSFNQNGLTPFSTNLAVFVDDIYLNIVFILLVLSGSSFFPMILRNVVLLSRRLAPWHHKVIFDYILLNNHHLSTLLYPSLQTRIYVVVSLLLYTMGIGISLILDLNGQALANYPPGIRFMIFAFQTVNLRFCGFQTIDISLLTTATIVVYLLLMITKPQMLCALDESPFEIYWLTLETQAAVDTKTKQDPKRTAKLPSSNLQRRISVASVASTDALVFKQMKQFLRRQSIATKELAKQEFSRAIEESKSSQKHSQRLHGLRVRLFLIHFVKALLKHTFNYVVLTRTWLFVFIFLICAFEYEKMAPTDPNITLLKIIFETISAFGGVGASLGYPGAVTSFVSVLTPGSKIILIIIMLMGRHRGLLASMKDQEVTEYNAVNVLQRHREEYILQHRVTQNMKENVTIKTELNDSKIVFF